jgi:hypothetical protein
MAGYHQFCNRCGHELNPQARFCGMCSHPVAQNSGQPAATDEATESRAAAKQAPDFQPRYAQAVTAYSNRAVPVQAGASHDHSGQSAVRGAAGGTAPDRGGPSSGEASSSRPSQSEPARRAARRGIFRRTLALALAVLVVAAATCGVLFFHRFASHRATGTRHAPVTASSATGTRASSSAGRTRASRRPFGPPTQLDIQGMTIGIGAVSTDPEAGNVAAIMAAYFAGIDTRDYLRAWDTFTPSLQASIQFQPWSSALSTSYDSQVVVQGIQPDPAGGLDATVVFQSHQAPQYGPNPGETCTNWSLDYQLVPSGAQQAAAASSSAAAPSGSAPPRYLINAAAEVGAGHAPC